MSINKSLEEILGEKINIVDNFHLTIDIIYKELLELLKRENKIKNVSSRLLAIKDCDEKVLYVYDLIKSYKLLPAVSKLPKCEVGSTHYRNLGNQLYKQSNLYGAWQYYNMAFCYAPETSESYGLALSNRTAVFAELKKYKACLLDIETVFASKHPAHIRDKLIKRKTLCEEALKAKGYQKESEDEDNLPDFLKLKGPRNRRYLSSSAKLTVQFSEEMGRHVVANEDIKVGEVIVQDEPYTNTLLKSQFYFACAKCFSRTPNLYPCKECCLTMYCSRECMKQAYRELHAYECPLKASLTKLEFSKLELLAVSVVIKAFNDCDRNWIELLNLAKQAEEKMQSKDWGLVKSGAKFVYDSKCYPAIHTLATNQEKRDISDIFQKSVSAAILLHCLAVVNFLAMDEISVKEKAKRFVAATLLRHLMTAPTNMHGITTNVETDDGNYVEEYNIGSAPYAFLSLINHSCSPNVVRFEKLGTAQMGLIALRPIKKGMQLYDNYGFNEVIRDERHLESHLIRTCKQRRDLISLKRGQHTNKNAHHAVHTKEERQAILKSQYKFVCVCEACVDNWPLYHNLSHGNLPADILFKKNRYLCEQVIEGLQKADRKVALNMYKPLCDLATALEPYIPCKEAADCQEAIKQCIAIICGVLPKGYKEFVSWHVPPPPLPGQPNRIDCYETSGAEVLQSPLGF